MFLTKTFITFLALSSSLSVYAAKDQQAIELKDGTTLIIQTDGKMRHVDNRGHAVLMKEGVAMEAKDGSQYMMKNNAIWKQLYFKGTLNPKQ